MHRSQPLGGIVWLASYPKSGNTWLRALLTNALRPAGRPADVNALLGAGAAQRQVFDEWSGVKSTDLTPEEVELARPRVYEAIARHANEPLFLKVHDAYTRNSSGEPLFPASVTRAVIYVVRHPAAVAESYAHHRGCSLEEALDLLADPDHRLADGSKGVEGQLAQRLLTWGDHVASWLDSPLPTCCVRYEDLSADPEGSLAKVLAFLGETVPAQEIARAVQFASFAELSKQERERGFHERPGRTRAFFRAGRNGELDLSAPCSLRVNSEHALGLTRVGYGGKQYE